MRLQNLKNCKTIPCIKDAKMLQSVEEVYEEILMDRGMEKGKEETAVNLLRSGWLTKEQIAETTELSIQRINELEKNLNRR